MDDKIIITCMRAEDADPRCIIEGSTKDICQTCWKEVWISPATLKFKEQLAFLEKARRRNRDG